MRGGGGFGWEVSGEFLFVYAFLGPHISRRASSMCKAHSFEFRAASACDMGSQHPRLRENKFRERQTT